MPFGPPEVNGCKKPLDSRHLISGNEEGALLRGLPLVAQIFKGVCQQIRFLEFLAAVVRQPFRCSALQGAWWETYDWKTARRGNAHPGPGRTPDRFHRKLHGFFAQGWFGYRELKVHKGHRRGRMLRTLGQATEHTHNQSMEIFGSQRFSGEFYIPQKAFRPGCPRRTACPVCCGFLPGCGVGSDPSHFEQLEKHSRSRGGSWRSTGTRKFSWANPVIRPPTGGRNANWERWGQEIGHRPSVTSFTTLPSSSPASRKYRKVSPSVKNTFRLSSPQPSGKRAKTATSSKKNRLGMTASLGGGPRRTWEGYSDGI